MGAPGAGNRVSAGPSVFGWTRHPTDPSNKFLISVGLRNGEGDFVYAPGVTFSYIAYGKNPDRRALKWLGDLNFDTHTC